MVANRAEALAEELHESKQAHNKDKEALTASKLEVINLRKQLRMSEYRQKVAEGDLQLLVLKCKFREGDGECFEGVEAVHTDDKALKAILPDAPVHHPEMYKARSDRNSKIQNTAPSVNPEPGRHSDHLVPDLEDEDTADSSHGTKRKFDEANSEESNDSPAMSNPSPSRRLIVCIRCYQLKLRCDTGEPCNNCVSFNHICKRAKCNDYEVGACRRSGCLRAHRGDEKVYKNIVRAGHIPRTDPSRPIIPRSKKQRKDDDDGEGGSGNSGGGGTRTGIALPY